MEKENKKPGRSKETLAIFWKASLRHRGLALLISFAVIAASVAGIIIPLYFRDFFNIIAGVGDRRAIFAGLVTALTMIAIFKAVEWLFWRIATFAVSKFETRIMADLTEDCFAYLHKHSFSYFNNNFVGSMVRRVRSFAGAFETVADNIFWDLLPLAVSAGSILFILLRISPVLGFGVIGWLVFYLAVSFLFSRFKLKYDIQRNEAESSASALLADTITNNANVKLMNGYDREVKGFTKAIEALRSARRTSWDLGNVFEAIQGFLMSGLTVGMLFIAVNLWRQNALTVGDFVLIQSYLGNIFDKVWGLGRVIRRFYESLADASEMTEILNMPHEIRDAEGATELSVEKGRVDFKDVGFKYGDSRPILSEFNLSISPGEKVALIGPSGAGKTTVIKLLLRMHTLTQGKIEIDGQDIALVTQESLWKSISLVPQDPILFHRSLMENIRYGRPEATDEEVIEAAKAAHCHEFVTSSPQGYDTFVGERGIKLSGGERQRVAIARAILRNAPILVLDEATSSLDSESESLIQDALNGLMKNKTVIVIAHRLSTIKKMDRIIAIDGGKIVEEGSHLSLSANEGGMYRRLWELQAGGFMAE
ncbi:MAG: ABC transporter ATP-binding protein [Candidatus Colwellbacteria bacterium]|nr:ABC transporter ATP-binding protein [Candidatus Colwellbacteria bacterium]